MAYKTGDLELVTAATLDELYGAPDLDEDPHEVYDNRGSGVTYPPVVRLPHSCDSWVIGGPEQVAAMIRDLQEMLDNWPN